MTNETYQKIKKILDERIKYEHWIETFEDDFLRMPPSYSEDFTISIKSKLLFWEDLFCISVIPHVYIIDIETAKVNNHNYYVIKCKEIIENEQEWIEYYNKLRLEAVC